MRLTPHQRTVIRQTSEKVFGPGVEVYLFGSRLDDSRRGGDIDLLIIPQEAVPRPALSAARCASQLERRLDGRHVDVVIQSPELQSKPIHQIARQTGQRV
ncbi:nucleotidyltransferase domain-containing protein [Marinimicrobium locisalis]|uniref:nucleotidyltransferase domain-containing protein n=1 Tax=Marinimicrobium locisalis TaxID=546022 RepID=UPI003D3007D7